MGSVGREGAFFGCRQRKLVRERAIDRQSEKLVEAAVAYAVARGSKQHLLAIRGPADGLIIPRVIRQASRHTALRRYDVDVHIAVILARKGDQRAIGGEMRVSLAPGMAGQSPRVPALAV